MPRRNPRRDEPKPLAFTLGPQKKAREVCASKDRYATESEARAIAIMHVPGRGDRSLPYHCEVCDGWHLTSRR
jgi:hypothetical protein